MSEIKNYFDRLRWTINDQEVRESKVRSDEDWHLAGWVVGTLLLTGVLLGGLVWMAHRDAQGWQAVQDGKQDRARNVGNRFVLNQKDLKR